MRSIAQIPAKRDFYRGIWLKDSLKGLGSSTEICVIVHDEPVAGGIQAQGAVLATYTLGFWAVGTFKNSVAEIILPPVHSPVI